MFLELPPTLSKHPVATSKDRVLDSARDATCPHGQYHDNESDGSVTVIPKTMYINYHDSIRRSSWRLGLGLVRICIRVCLWVVLFLRSIAVDRTGYRRIHRQLRICI